VVSIRSSQTAPQTDIKALVQTYEVLEEKRVDPNNYEVKLKVWIYDYQPLDKNNRLRIAVMTPKTDEKEFKLGNIEYAEPSCKELENQIKPLTISDKKLQYIIMQALNSKLNATNKFAVLDRAHIDKIMAEKNLIWNAGSSLEEQSKIGNFIGADYILVITVNQVKLPVRIIGLPDIGQCTCNHEAYVNLDYSLIGASAGNIKYTNTIVYTFADRDVRSFVSHWVDTDIDYLDVVQGLLETSVTPIVENITQSLYPIRIAKVLPNGLIIINKGGNDVLVSSTYEVLKQGEDVLDYDTKESLGKVEQPIAAIKITRVMSNFSYATLINGDPNALSEGLICRINPALQPQVQAPAPTTDTQLTPSGGIKMPFDNKL